MAAVVLVIGDVRRGAGDLLAVLARLARSTPAPTVHSLIAGSRDDAVRLRGWVAQVRVLLSSGPLAAESWLETLVPWVEALAPRAILAPHGELAYDVLPALAGCIGAACDLDCLGLEISADTTTSIREQLGGKIRQQRLLPAAVPLVASLRSGMAADTAPSPGIDTAIEALQPVAGSTSFVRSEITPAVDVDIGSASIVVGVGRGIGHEKNLKLYREIAAAVGGVVAASRPVVDLGWMPRGMQVGQSGRKIAPHIYLACGISGAPQHVLGIQKAGTIIAVNKDESAPIFAHAHVGVVADLAEFAPALLQAIGHCQQDNLPT